MLGEHRLLVHRSDEVQELTPGSFENESEDHEHEADESESEGHDEQDEPLVGVLLKMTEVIHRHERADRQVGEPAGDEPEDDDAAVGEDGLKHGYSRVVGVC